MLSWLCSCIATAIVIHATNTQLLVKAQLFVGCKNEVTDDGVAYEACLYNAPSPLTVELGSGSFVSFGTKSSAFIYCLSDYARSPDTCDCNVLVNPSDPVASTDFCNSCTVQVISDTEFLPYFDCSNRLVGTCVGFDAAGICIDNSGSVVPAPVGTLVPPPTPFPDIRSASPQSTAFPFNMRTLDPAPTAVIASEPLTIKHARKSGIPIGSVKSENQKDVPATSTDDSSESIIGIAIGCVVGGFAFAVVIGYFVFSRGRKQARTNNQPSIISTSTDPYIIRSNTDDDFRSAQSPPVALRPVMSNWVKLSRPSPSTEPPLYPITEVASDNTNTEEILVAINNRNDDIVPGNMKMHNSNTTPQAAAAEVVPSSTSRLPSFPGNNSFVHAKNQRRDIGKFPQPPSSTREYQGDRGIPFSVTIGVSTATSTSSLSATSTTMTEPSGRMLLDA
jgi:hypothetical protein